MSEGSSADRLRERLSGHEEAIRAYTGEALYNMEVEWTCRMLDAVDTVVDHTTAALITDVIYERLTSDGVSEATQRQRDARAELERLMRQPLPPMFLPPRA